MAWPLNALLSTVAVLFAGQCLAQRKDGQYWPCNPTTNATGSCTPNYGLDRYSYSIDFTNPPSDLDDYWSTSDYANTTYSTLSNNGAEFTFWQAGNAPQLYSNFYIFFGHVDVVLQVAPGTGMITSSVLLSDDFDEIDWEMSGNNFNMAQYYSGGVIPDKYKNGTVQNNYFGKGITGSYDRGQWEACTNPQTQFHTYSVDWTPTRVEWLIDGVVVRTLLAANADNTTHQFPQTPSRIQIGIWDGGAATEDYGTYVWAGGRTNVSQAPFTAYLKSISIKNYYPARYYNYTDQSGKWTSIKQLNTSLPASYSTTATSAASSTTSILPLKTNLPVTENGHCGVNVSTICGGAFGKCCSPYGYCGSTTEYCGTGCQTDYGLCGSQNAAGNASADGTTTLSVASTSTSTSILPLLTKLPVSSTGTCGAANGTTCKGSGFGDCCSAYGYCGNGTDYCAIESGCQSAYGSCDITSASEGSTAGSSISRKTTTITSTVMLASSTAKSTKSTMSDSSDSTGSGLISSSSKLSSTSPTTKSFSSFSSTAKTSSATTVSSSSSVAPSTARSTSPTAAAISSTSPISTSAKSASSSTTKPTSVSSTKSSPSAVTGAVCMKYDGTTVADSNGESYAVICNTKNSGSVLSTVITATNIPECLPFCDKLPSCKAVMFHEDLNQCYLLSSIGSNTYADKYNLAVRQSAGTSGTASVKTTESLTTATRGATSSVERVTSAAAATATTADAGRLGFLINILENWAQGRGH